MKKNRLNKLSGVVMGTAALSLLFPFALTSGCAEKSAGKRAEEEQKFLAPTNVSKLRPEAQEALSHMPGGAKAPPADAAPATK